MNSRFNGNELKYLTEVIESGFGSGTTGSMNMRLEQYFCQKMGTRFAITSNSGTSTLHQALLACGVGPGEEVIIPALTVAMCGFAVVYTGAKPVFADIDPNSFLIDPDDIERKITSRTKVIMVVNLYGQMCDMDRVMSIAKEYNIFVIEDCAQCYLARDQHDRLSGTIGHVGSFSLQTSKHITTGDGGILITNDERLAELMRKFGGLGFRHIKGDRRKIKKNKDLFQMPGYLRHDTIGFNFRMSELEAAVALAQLERLDELVERRRVMAKYYLDVLASNNCRWLIPQTVADGHVGSYWTFVCKFEGKEQLGINWQEFWNKYREYGGDGIYSAWALVYQEPAFRELSRRGAYSQALMTVHAPQLIGFLDNNDFCPNAEVIQPKLMQFTTNQLTDDECQIQATALDKTIKYFEKG